MNRFIVGSRAFFDEIEGFVPDDTDILLLEDDPKDYKVQCQIRLKGNCYFKWRRMSALEMIDAHKGCECGMFIGKFLVPAFAEEIGLTIEQLKLLQFLVDKLDERHTYEKEIYYFYILNGGFFLTEEQLQKVYKIYLKYKK